MFEITPAASERIREFMAEGKAAPIRVRVKSSLTEDPTLGLTFDERKSTDTDFEVDGITYLVDRELLEAIQPIRIDADSIGLQFSSRLKTDQDGCGCGCGGH